MESTETKREIIKTLWDYLQSCQPNEKDIINATRAAWKTEVENAVAPLVCDEFSRYSGKNIAEEKIISAVQTSAKDLFDIEIKCCRIRVCSFGRLDFSFVCNETLLVPTVGRLTNGKRKIEFQQLDNRCRTPEQILKRCEKIKEAEREFQTLFDRFQKLKSAWKEVISRPCPTGGMFLEVGKLNKPEILSY